MPYSAGTAYLTVVPSFVNIERAFRREADNLARIFNDAFRDVGADAVREGLRGAGNDGSVRAEGERAGDRFGGAFKQMFGRRIEEARKAAGDFRVDADISPAERAMAHIKAQLTALRNEIVNINVDVPEEHAIAEVARIRAAADALDNDDVTIEIRTNARAVRAEMDALLKSIGANTSSGLLHNLGGEQGRIFGGAYADAAKRAVREGLAALGPIEIDLDSSPAEIHAAELRTRLEALGRRLEIGVDIDADRVHAQIAAIAAQLRALGKDDPDIRIKTNFLTAAAELELVQERVDKLDKSNPKPGDQGMKNLADAADFSIGRLGALISIGALIGPIIVPAAAAAAVAIGGIATAAIAAGTGIGVAVLGLSHVFTAVGALNQAQAASRKSSVSLAGAQDRVANALDGVKTAERGLEAAREQAARSARDAARAVVAAERDVVDAQRDAEQAQRDLIRAQEDAKRAAQDQAFSIRDNALAQRQANLDLADAKAELDKILTNPRATEQEREQAQITFEQRKLQFEELGVAGKRLEEDQARIAKNGADNVIAAQERVRAANQRVADAQEKVARAIESQTQQQRDSARQVLAAQESVVKAQRSLQQAYDKTGVAGGAAMDNVRKAMENLSPAGQHFAQFLFGLKGDFQQLQFAAEKGLLPGLEKGIKSLLPFLGGLTQFVGKVGQALGNIFVDMTGSFDDPVWQRFFGFIDRTAVPALNGMYQVAKNLAAGIAGLIMGLSPFNEDMGDGLIKLSEAFARWGESLDTNSGFQRFIAYVQRVGPKVVDLLENLAVFIGHVVEAAAPIGEKVLAAFNGLFSAINDLPIPVLFAMVLAIGSLAGAVLLSSAVFKAYTIGVNLATAATKAWQIATALARAELVIMTAVQRAAATVMAFFGTSAQSAATRSAVFGQAMTGIRTATSVARTGLSSLVGFLGGPWGIAMAAATLAVVALIEQQQKIKSASQNMQNALSNIASAFGEGGDAAVIALARQDQAVAQAIVQLRQYGVSAKDVFAAQNGDIEAQGRVLDALRERLKELNDEIAANPRPGNAPDKRVKDLRDQTAALGGVIKDLEGKYRDSTAAADSFGQSADDIAQAQTRARIAANQYGSQISDLEVLYATLTGKTQDAAAVSDVFRRATENATKAGVSATEADEQYTRSLVDLRAQMQSNGGELDIHKGKTDDQTRAILANRDALEEALRSARDKTLADIAAKVPIDEATAASQARIAEILKEIPATQRNSAVVKELVGRYGALPKEVTTKLNTDGAEEVLKQLKDLKVAQYALEHNLTIAAARAALAKDLNTFESQVPAQARAAGGHITGPGGPTDDKIPAWLSNGEYVIPAWLVRKLGVGFFDRLLSSRTAGFMRHTDASPGFASGGHVNWPFTVNASKTFIPFTMEQLQQQFAGQPGGVTPGGLGWKRMIEILRGPFPGLALLSGFRPGAITVTGNKSYHAVGRAVDVPPRDDVFNWIHDHYGNSRELIFTPEGSRQIWNGHPHVFSDPVAAQHYSHVHWAYDQGGWLPPGMSTVYNGTGSPEPVLTGRQWDDISVLANSGRAAGGNTYTFQFRDTTLTPGRLKALQDRDALLHRDGRAR